MYLIQRLSNYRAKLVMKRVILLLITARRTTLDQDKPFILLFISWSSDYHLHRRSSILLAHAVTLSGLRISQRTPTCVM